MALTLKDAATYTSHSMRAGILNTLLGDSTLLMGLPKPPPPARWQRVRAKLVYHMGWRLVLKNTHRWYEDCD